MRILVLLALAVILYYVLKGFFRPRREVGDTERGSSRAGWAESKELVQDPYCQTYIPRNTAVRARIDGENLYFCSEECMNRYLGEQKRTSGL
jgi:uncharacterized protein